MGVEFSTGPPMWAGVLIIFQNPLSLLSVRLASNGAQEDYRAAPLPGVVGLLSPLYPVGGSYLYWGNMDIEIGGFLDSTARR